MASVAKKSCFALWNFDLETVDLTLVIINIKETYDNKISYKGHSLYKFFKQ